MPTFLKGMDKIWIILNIKFKKLLYMETKKIKIENFNFTQIVLAFLMDFILCEKIKNLKSKNQCFEYNDYNNL